MTTPTLALLEATDSATGRISPTSVFVHLVLSGDKFFSGNAAFSQAEELRKLAEALQRRGVASAALGLEGASMDVSSGVFTKSSTVTYRVRVLVEDLELLGGVLDAVGETKKASLSRLEWNYDESGPEQRQLLRTAGERAVAKARLLAESVGAKLGELHAVREERPAPGGRPEITLAAPQAAPARQRSVADELSGLELAPKRQVTVRVTVAYVIDSD